MSEFPLTLVLTLLMLVVVCCVVWYIEHADEERERAALRLLRRMPYDRERDA